MKTPDYQWRITSNHELREHAAKLYDKIQNYKTLMRHREEQNEALQKRVIHLEQVERDQHRELQRWKHRALVAEAALESIGAAL